MSAIFAAVHPEMTHQIHHFNAVKIAEMISDNVLLNSGEDAVDLLGSLYFEDVDRIVIYQHHLAPAFFDLQNGIAGEVLQKFSNYRVRLAIVGDFTNITARSVRDFIYESNRQRNINFVSSVEEAVAVLAAR